MRPIPGSVIAFRSLARSDLPMLRRWLNTPHVYEWWGCHVCPGALGGAGKNAATEAQVEAKYGSEIDHGGTTHRFIIEHEGAPIGLIQWYHLRDFAAYARAIGEDPAATTGIDLLIGEPGALGQGLGTRAIDAFVTSVVFRGSDVDRVLAGPAATNARSIQVFAKAGFRRVRSVSLAAEPVPEAIMVRLKT
jgi:aminoglycoside 6'-N-acetyltransferase